MNTTDRRLANHRAGRHTASFVSDCGMCLEAAAQVTPDGSIREMRLEMGLSIRGIAQMLDVAPSSVQRWETEGAPRSIQLAVQMLRVQAQVAMAQVAKVRQVKVKHTPAAEAHSHPRQSVCHCNRPDGCSVCGGSLLLWGERGDPCEFGHPVSEF